MEKLAKSINDSILENETVKEYLKLKEDIKNDNNLQELKGKLDSLRKEICKDKSKDSEEYFKLLEMYKNNEKVKKYETLYVEIKSLMVNVSDILSLK